MGVGTAVKYGYSNTRVKAMESKLIDEPMMRSMAEAKSVDAILAILFQTDYNAAIVKFGGLEISPMMVDFAVSDNLAARVNKLADITPKSDQHIIRKIISRWDLSNVKLVLEAVDRKQPYDSVSRYLISSSEFTQQMLQEVMREGTTVEDAFAKLMRNRAYQPLLAAALKAYRKTGNILDAISTIDTEHYRELGELSLSLGDAHDKSVELLRMDIDMRNMIVLLLAKRHGLKFSDVSKRLISNGNSDVPSLSKAYGSSEDVAALALKSRTFDLAGAAEVYKENGQLLSFEISMRNQIFTRSRKMLRLSVLTFGALIDYMYLKEIEVFTLRALIKGKEYGLSQKEMSRLVSWSQ